MNPYHIEYEMFDGKWVKMAGFSYIRKSFAEGAWAMLRAHYNHKSRYRLLRCNEVIETMSKLTVGV